MPEDLSVEIPKGTVILLNNETKILTKSLKLGKQGENLIVQNLSDVTMKDDERLGDNMNALPEVKKFKMPKCKEIKEQFNLDVVDLAYKISSNPDIDSSVRKNANKVLNRILNREIAKYSTQDGKTSDKEQISD